LSWRELWITPRTHTAADYRSPVTSRRFAAIAALSLVAGLLGGCVAEPAPAETTPGFASEEEAFAAAEETYRAYVDALNQVDLSDPETFEPVFALTTGELNASDREGLSGYHADGFTVQGDSVITILEPHDYDPSTQSAFLSACLDVSAVDVVDAAGNSVVASDRVAIQTLMVTVVTGGSSPTGGLVSVIGPRQDAPACIG